MKPEFAPNICEGNLLISDQEFHILELAIGTALSDSDLAKQVLRTQDFAEWQKYLDSEFPPTRNGCSISAQLVAQILGQRALIGYGMVTDSDPFDSYTRLGEHYRVYVDGQTSRTFHDLDIGNKTSPLSADFKPADLSVIDATFNQFTECAIFTLCRLRSTDQFKGLPHEDTLRRTNLLAYQVRALLLDQKLDPTSSLAVWKDK